MDTIDRVLSSGAERSERARDERRRSRNEMLARNVDKPYAVPSRAQQVRTDGRAIDVEIAHSEKLLRDLAGGMRNLRALNPAPYDLDERILVQASKIRSVETKLLRLRQGRLL